MTDDIRAGAGVFDLSGRVAVVTGGARDIGRSIALGLARSGADVLLTYNTSASDALPTAEQIRDLGVRADTTSFDAHDDASIAALAETARDFGKGTVHILVNNAGGQVRPARLADLDRSLLEETMRLNFFAPALLCKALVPTMVERGFGRVINIGSVAARNGAGPTGYHYAAAKAAVTSLARTLTNEFGGSGVTFNTVAPGFVDNTFHKNSPEELKQRIISRIPLGRPGQNDDIAGAVQFLASVQASWISGAIIDVNGGSSYTT